MKTWVLRGEGIECERESFRFFQALGLSPQDWPLPMLLKNPRAQFDRVQDGDLVFLPGGFSYSDHFGAGTLLAYRLQEIGFFQTLKNKAIHMMGVCNGFQVLVASKIFGETLDLLPNQVNGQALGFINRWCQVQCLADQQMYSLPIRHGEGRLSGEWSLNAKPFLKYVDFDNGSRDQVAGLWIQTGQAQVWGMMPHPEIVLRFGDHPNRVGPEYVLNKPYDIWHGPGDGRKLIESLLGNKGAW